MPDLIVATADELEADRKRIAELETLAKTLLRQFHRVKGGFRADAAEGQIGRWWSVLDGDR